MTGPSIAEQWALDRIDRRCREALDVLLGAVADDIATAAGAAVAVRMLSSDGGRLTPLAAHHPDAARGAAMSAVMSRTEPVDSGLWATVIATRRPARWHNGDHLPVEASAPQTEFIRRHAIRAVMGVPLLSGGRMVGGVALVRFAVDRAFTDDDERLLLECGGRLAPLVDGRRIVDERLLQPSEDGARKDGARRPGTAGQAGPPGR